MNDEFNYLDIANGAKVQAVSSVANLCHAENVLSLEKQVTASITLDNMAQ
jgi:hypothetical protein